MKRNLILFRGYNWESFAANSPYFSRYNPNVENNFVLKYFMNSLLVFVLGVLFYSKLSYRTNA